MIRSPALSALFAATLSCTLGAQAAWTQLNPMPSPLGRTGAAFAGDGGGLLVFGGLDSNAVYNNDLWRFDGAAWTNLTPSPLPASWPSGRYRHAAAWDLGRGRLVAFGGGLTNQGSSRVNDTWEWDGTQWFQMSPATSPSARWWHSMAYDFRSNAVLLFGGQDSTGRLNETWSWDGTNWTQLSPANVPPVRERAAMTSNIISGEIVLFGGNPGGGVELGDTWIWDGLDWRPVTTPTIPYGTGTRNAGMTYDLARDRIVLYGGVTGGVFQSNTWEFDGQDWVDRGLSPLAARTFPAIAYVLTAAKTFLFSGFTGVGGSYYSDTWEYQTNAVATYAATGTGCGGAVGVPLLNAAAPPWLGATLEVQASNLAPTAVPFMLVGLSSTSFSGGTLPFPLTQFGAPQCSLLVRPDATAFIPNQGSSATWTFGIPNNPALIGQAFFNQCLALEPGGGGLTIVASGRGDGVIGAL